jgi:hypothetical protein
MAKGRKATATDADLCIKLYELRRNPEMRNARDFINFYFQPQSADDILKVLHALGTRDNAWARQVFSFWENAASLILLDVVQPDLFFAWNSEMVFVYAKFKPFLAEVRQKMENPAFLAGVEKAVNSSPEMRKKVALLQKRLAMVAENTRAAKTE